MKSLTLGLIGLSALATACVADAEQDPSYDPALLAEFRRAVPTAADLQAPAAEATTATLLGDPAIYPYASAEIVFGINGTVAITVGLLDLITSTPPTFYDSESKEFVWGPFPAEVGYTAAYIRDTEGAGDFRYEFAFLQGATNDLATLTPIVWGGGTPDPVDDDRGVGVALWDMTAARAFAEQHDPDFDPAAHGSGRFAALFGNIADENDPATDFAFVVAAFRDFVDAGSDEAPVDLDYLYGRHASAAATVDFIDFEADIDVSEPLDDVRERVGVRMAFLDGGTGRAEADAIDGSLAAGERFDVTECWDTSLVETYLSIERMEEGQVVDTIETGAVADCGLFEASLDDLSVPSLQDIDPELIATLDEAASTGAP